jgi:hypothetical protein
MRNKQVLLRTLPAIVLGVLLCSSSPWAQQMSSPELVLVQNTKAVSLKPSDPQAITVSCPADTRLVSGGGGSDVASAAHFSLAWSMPNPGSQSENDGWSVGVVNRSLVSRKGHIFVYAMCVKTNRS